MIENEVYITEKRHNEDFTYPIDSACGLHLIGQALIHHKGDKKLSFLLRSLGTIVENVARQIVDENQEQN